MIGKVYRARVKKLEAIRDGADPYVISATVGELPDPEQRRKIEAEDPDTRYIWIEKANG